MTGNPVPRKQPSYSLLFCLVYLSSHESLRTKYSFIHYSIILNETVSSNSCQAVQPVHCQYDVSGSLFFVCFYLS